MPFPAHVSQLHSDGQVHQTLRVRHRCAADGSAAGGSALKVRGVPSNALLIYQFLLMASGLGIVAASDGGWLAHSYSCVLGSAAVGGMRHGFWCDVCGALSCLGTLEYSEHLGFLLGAGAWCCDSGDASRTVRHAGPSLRRALWPVSLAHGQTCVVSLVVRGVRHDGSWLRWSVDPPVSVGVRWSWQHCGTCPWMVGRWSVRLLVLAVMQSLLVDVVGFILRGFRSCSRQPTTAESASLVAKSSRSSTSTGRARSGGALAVHPGFSPSVRGPNLMFC